MFLYACWIHEPTIMEWVKQSLNQAVARLVLEVRDDGAPFEQPEESPRPQKIHIQSFSHMSEFGWGFPEVDEAAANRRKVDLSWIQGYDKEIGRLKAEVRRQKALSCNHLGRENGEEGKEGEEGEEGKRRLGLPHNAEGKEPADAPLGSVGACEELRAESPPATPLSEACFSLRSFTSRDSGVYAADDTSECSPEVAADRSFLEELEDLSDHDLSVDTSFGRCENVPEAPAGRGEGKDKYPVCFQRPDDVAELTVKLSYLNWNASSCPVSPSETVCDATFVFGASSAERSSQSLDETRRQRLRGLWTACDRLEASALRGGVESRGVGEVMQLVESLSTLDDRLRLLRCDLDALMVQARENMTDFDLLQNQACRLASRTEGSRQRLAQAVGLEKVCAALEERLHEEWWAAHCPNLLPEHENYIV
ncbi:uncharacterized protein LOC122260770 [Penaeus japonicus]|uniref:uncharacterized protein LOC122260770 n=1 Tax=Penaeus japonicus TaxID=27405 RepID=UPI001C713062|nr:uncharacterized protein LOC122260770 [Penaeus japonicus]